MMSNTEPHEHYWWYDHLDVVPERRYCICGRVEQRSVGDWTECYAPEIKEHEHTWRRECITCGAIEERGVEYWPYDTYDPATVDTSGSHLRYDLADILANGTVRDAYGVFDHTAPESAETRLAGYPAALWRWWERVRPKP